MKKFLDNNISTIKKDAGQFPAGLRALPDCPEQLFYRGNISPLLSNNNCFAIVGTRRATGYGLSVTFEFAKTLAKTGFTIVSGMALGIDTQAHKGALASNGKTIAVLATGLSENDIYPQENLPLAKEILQNNGALISEKPNGSVPFASSFLQRNRIISGLSVGVLVIEAKIKSGALNTAMWAKKQGKMVFAVPGNINQTISAGCNLLIQKGAFLTTHPNDILEKLGLKKVIKQQTITGNNSTETAILQLLKQQPLNTDQIIEKTNLKPEQVLQAITMLEAESKIKCLAGNTYAITNS